MKPQAIAISMMDSSVCITRLRARSRPVRSGNAWGRAEIAHEEPLELAHRDTQLVGDLAGALPGLDLQVHDLDGARQVAVPAPVLAPQRDALGGPRLAQAV